MSKNHGSTLAQDTRHAEPGTFWNYSLAVLAGDRCRLELDLSDTQASSIAVSVLGHGGKPLPVQIGQPAPDQIVATWTMPQDWPLGAPATVTIGAHGGPATVAAAQFSREPLVTRIQGVPDELVGWMEQGTAATARAADSGAAANVAFASSAPADPSQDTAPALVILSPATAQSVQTWKARQCSVWAAASALGPAGSAAAGAQHAAMDASSVAALLTTGADGVFVGVPGFTGPPASAPGFDQAWREGSGSAPVTSSASDTFRAGAILDRLAGTQLSAALAPVLSTRPGAARAATIRSPLDNVETGREQGPWSIAARAPLTDILGQVTARSQTVPVRYRGDADPRSFVQAYLSYTYVANLVRDTPRRFWVDLIPPAATSPADVAWTHYEERLVAALLACQPDGFVCLDADALGHLPQDMVSRLQALSTVLRQAGRYGRPDPQPGADIGVLLGDTAEWQAPLSGSAALDGFFGISLPLLEQGVAVQTVPLERSVDPGYLSRYRTLLLSYDFQKPLAPPTNQAIADWVRHGGSLLFIGGSDAFNSVAGAWWRSSGAASPAQDLWNRLGIHTGPPVRHSAPPEQISAYRPVSGTPAGSTFSYDLTRWVRQNGSVAVRILALPGSSATVSAVDLLVNGETAASFLTGTDLETRFLAYDSLSEVGPQGRYVSGDGWWTYRFDNLPADSTVTLRLQSGGPLRVEAAPALPDYGHTLLTTGSPAGIAGPFPRLQIGDAYAATSYQAIDQNPAGSSVGPNGQSPTPIYMLRSGGAPVWMARVGQGTVINVGVAPGFFSASPKGADLLRALARLAEQRAGGIYRERKSLVAQRGKLVAVRTFGLSRTVPGRTIDLLSPDLNVADARTVPPHSVALLLSIGPDSAAPHIGFVAGKLTATLESAQRTAFCAAGPLGTQGMARIHKGAARLVGAQALGADGRPVPIQVEQQGDTVLIRYANSPDGVAVRIGWAG